MSSVGVDIGATGIRVVRIKKVDRSGYAIIDRVARTPLAEGSVYAGRVENPTTVARALERTLKAAGVSRYGFILGIEGAGTALGQRTLPASLTPQDRIQAITYKGEEISPLVPLRDATLATDILTTARRNGNEEADLAVLAANTDQLNTLLQVAKLARTSPRAIDLSAAALLRALVRAPEKDQTVATVADIGATKITVSTRQGRNIRSLRTASGGGIELTRALMSATKEGFDAAEKRKRYLRLPDRQVSPVTLESRYGGQVGEEDEETLVEEALRTVVERMIDSVAEAINNDANHHATYTQGVALTGGSSLLPGLPERLADRIGVEVTVGKPWAVIEANRQTAPLLDRDGRASTQLMIELATAVGLATWEVPR